MPFRIMRNPTAFPSVAPDTQVVTPNDGTASTNSGQYVTQTVSLATAISNQPLTIGPGNSFAVMDGSPGSTASVVFDQAATAIPLFPGQVVNVPFTKAYLSCSAQAGFYMTFGASQIPQFTGT